MLRTPNTALWWVVGGATFFLGLVLYVPFLRDLFHLAPLHPVDLALCLAAGIFSVLWVDVAKVVRRWLKEPPMTSTIRLVTVMILLVAGLCLAIIGHLEGQAPVSVLGMVLFGLMSIWLVGALVLESLRRDRDTSELRRRRENPGRVCRPGGSGHRHRLAGGRRAGRGDRRCVGVAGRPEPLRGTRAHACFIWPARTPSRATSRPTCTGWSSVWRRRPACLARRRGSTGCQVMLPTPSPPAATWRTRRSRSHPTYRPCWIATSWPACWRVNSPASRVATRGREISRLRWPAG